ncbi:Glycine--tRNA ligase beta subunit [Candidatus Jidaibacter acanthamoeba]|uniref:glycine--tRNA ligase n=1 Tax=Candidatus Jidaibacter acanthamoebae TaxID=86105 RepID=A0A0C1QFS7_9RICK|nr:glycine--tRNA ligase subunit beta [Candidatus Jidaibacter acanthamoeba]KIE04424.1 Glycine--tRNA ligase beta subunit [Candidatus Jidaibacter acanthamoeba]
MSDFLLELFSEEMPAKMLAAFTAALEKNIVDKLGQKVESKSFYTPRRICIHINGLSTEVAEQTEEVKGPKESAPEAALDGFMRKYNLSDKSELELREGCYFYKLKRNQSDLKSVLKETVEVSLNQAIWPKSMRWGDYDIRWVRPLHSIVCFLDNEVLPVKFGHIIASNKTYGHRFLSGKEITVNSASLIEYSTLLKENFIILDALNRKEIIQQEIRKAISGKNLSIIEDNELLNEVVNLVEYPVVYLGQIDEKFMTLPEEVLITTLRNNQRYLMLRNSTSGKLAPYFIIVSNTIGQDQGKEIIHGNQTVLGARLFDALFFYENDKKIKLEKRIEQLKALTFHKEIGSVYDKVESVKAIAEKLSQRLQIDTAKVLRAVSLMKADLITEMVGEFPELQGIMGYYYALNDREDEDIAITIRDHYKPLGPNDYVPTNKVAAIVALADKLDTLNQMFAINIKPTGSKDPFALRRAANGVVRIIAENNFALDIKTDLATFNIREDVINYISEREVISNNI